MNVTIKINIESKIENNITIIIDITTSVKIHLIFNCKLMFN